MVEFESILLDRKVLGASIAATMTIAEYLSLSEIILDNNPFQRRRVRTQRKIYALLRRDLVEGCIIPPIVLATTESYTKRVQNRAQKIARNGRISQDDSQEIVELAAQAVNDRELLILDGLQRTHTIREAYEDAKAQEKDKEFLERILRLEIYFGLTKQGLLYRMLTLNTGQTPMIFRHQLEILYHDYLDKEALPDDIEVLLEVNERRARGSGVYKYSSVIDLYQSYINRTSNPVDKKDILEELKTMDFLQRYNPEPQESQEELLQLLVLYNRFVKLLDSTCEEWKYAGERNIARPFGATIAGVFSKSQAMTGFGCACGKLIESGVYSGISDIQEKLESNFSPTSEVVRTAMNQLIEFLEQIRETTKRYGDAQRGFFEYYFRSLLDRDGDFFLLPEECVPEAYDRYTRVFL